MISIHALREEGDIHTQKLLNQKHISIHALREEGDAPKKDTQKAGQISIHALREEGDQTIQRLDQRGYDFYPRPPRGGRQQKQRQNLYFLINYTTFCTNLEEP